MRAAYLAGMIDGEGTVAKAPEKVAVIYNNDPHLIYASAWCAVHLGIRDMRLNADTRLPKVHWHLCFYKKRSFLILSKLPIQTLSKRERLQAILNSYKGRQKKDWDRARARSLLAQGLTPWQVAARVGVDYTTVQQFVLTERSS